MGSDRRRAVPRGRKRHDRTGFDSQRWVWSRRQRDEASGREWQGSDWQDAHGFDRCGTARRGLAGPEWVRLDWQRIARQEAIVDERIRRATSGSEPQETSGNERQGRERRRPAGPAGMRRDRLSTDRAGVDSQETSRTAGLRQASCRDAWTRRNRCERMGEARCRNAGGEGLRRVPQAVDRQEAYRRATLGPEREGVDGQEAFRFARTASDRTGSETQVGSSRWVPVAQKHLGSAMQ